MGSWFSESGFGLEGFVPIRHGSHLLRLARAIPYPGTPFGRDPGSSQIKYGPQALDNTIRCMDGHSLHPRHSLIIPRGMVRKLTHHFQGCFHMSFQVTVLPSQHQFAANADQSVLEAAMAAGIVLPYSCRSGACSTCKAKVISGSVQDGSIPTSVLSDEEIEAGYKLLCQTHATSDLVIESREVRLATDIQIRKLPSRVTTMKKMADDVMVLELQLPAADTFRFYAGQYIEVILKDGKRRSYSMANAPHAASPIELHVRHLSGGLFTDHVFGTGATQMKEREILRLEGPYGSFFLREDSTLPIILLASGTGFAPIKAIVEHMIHHNVQRPVTLYWGGRRPADLYMNELAKSWSYTLPDFKYVPVISDALPEDGWTGRTGFVHRAVMEDFPDMSGYQVYACGAPIMVESARKEFEAVCKMPDDAFFADSFTSAADSAATKA